MITYANQKTVTVHKPSYTENFLQVSKDEWMDAFANLTRSSFGLYLYCCGNKNGYEFGLSSQAVQNDLGISDSSYRRAVEELLIAGYFIEGSHSKTLHFYTTPQPTSYVPKPKKIKKKNDGAAAPVLEEAPATKSVKEPLITPRSFSPDLEYSWED